MKNVKLEKPWKGKGWFLTIGDDVVNHRWAVSSLELWCVKKLIEDNIHEIMVELDDADKEEVTSDLPTTMEKEI